MEKQSDPLLLPWVPFVISSVPLVKYFSRLFIQALSCFYIYPISVLHPQFYLSSRTSTPTHKHAIIAPIFQNHSLDLTLLVSHFSFYLYSETWKRGLYFVSTSSHLSLFWTFSRKTFLPNPSYRGHQWLSCAKSKGQSSTFISMKRWEHNSVIEIQRLEIIMI